MHPVEAAEAEDELAAGVCARFSATEEPASQEFVVGAILAGVVVLVLMMLPIVLR